MVERAYEKHAWIILFVTSVLLVLAGLVDVALGPEADAGIIKSMTGMSWSNVQALNARLADYIAAKVEGGASYMLAIGLLGLATSAKAYRRGERWAWYAFWSLPLVIALSFVRWLSVGEVAMAVVFLSFAIISLLGLLSPYRKFFPRKAT